MTVALPLHTERLILRAFAATDRDAMQPLYDDPEVMRFIDTRGEDTTTWVEGYVAFQAAHGYAPWAVVSRETGELLGEAGLQPLDGRGPEIELGYLLRRDAWGRGLATEAAAACLLAAFDGLGLEIVEAVVEMGNDASVAVLRRVGFEPTGERVKDGVRQHTLQAVAGARRPA